MIHDRQEIDGAFFELCHDKSPIASGGADNTFKRGLECRCTGIGIWIWTKLTVHMTRLLEPRFKQDIAKLLDLGNNRLTVVPHFGGMAVNIWCIIIFRAWLTGYLVLATA